MTEKDDSQNIKKRLEELQKWQEEQQRMIDERQAEQRTKLYIEQKELYCQLGIFPLDENANVEDEKNQNNFEDLPKRKFLKRGEGLKNRFKIDPETLRLHNLPKYKYANVRKQSLKSKPMPKNQKDRHTINKSVTNINSNLINEIGTNKNKLNSVYHPFLKSTCRDEEDSICESFSANQEFKYVDLSTKVENSSICENIKEESNTLEHFTSENPITWAKVLNSYQVQQFPIKKFRDLSSSKLEGEVDDYENLSIFELLEKKTQQGSFNINASLIQKWIQEKANALFEASKEVEEEKKIKQCDIKNDITPVESSENSNSSSLTDDSENDNITDDEHDISFGNSKRSEIRQVDQSEIGHVRFCEEVQINHVKSSEGNSATKPFCSWKRADNELCHKSEDHSGFEKFKANLFTTAVSNGEDTSPNDITLIEQLLSIPLKGDEHRKDIIGKTELLKNRLVELENEISMFRQNNSELLRLKQEHELNKIQLEHDRLEMQEKLKDEKIKYEIHLHDERLKIEEDKKKLEKMIRDQKIPNRKERDEILKLKEDIEALQKELRNKESKHVVAQARLRAQIRTLEKEVKDLTFEIDNLKKENKKLESENARMTRQNNNKMLQEINKTIAKLSVKPVEVPVATEVIQNKNIKPVVAKVISHKRKSFVEQNQKFNTSRNCSYEKEQSSRENSDKEKFSSDSSDEEKYMNMRKNKNRQYRKASKKSQKQLDEFSNNTKLSENNNNKGNFNADDFKREIEHPDGSKDIWYPNGNLKKISADGMNIKMLYFNKDIKETNISEGTVRYYYAEKNTWHTTYLDGLEILEFPNGQTEHRYKDGTIEVHFPNGSIRISNSSDQHKLEEWRYADGTNSVQLRNGDKILSFPNGQKEIHTKIHKRREYPDGTVKIVYPDGSQETRYSNGRIRLKDKDGNLIMDSENKF